MRTLTALLVVVGLVLSMIPAVSHAQGSPVQLSLFNPVQIVPEAKGISGLRLNLIYTKNTTMTGFDVGLVNQTTGSVVGVQWTAVGLVGGDFEGWQSGAVNLTDGRFTGFQSAWLYNSTNHCKGLQIALVNTTETM